jgi:N-methylhydantoinase A
MEAEADAWLERERVAPVDRSHRCHVDARYEGQNFEVIVPLARPAADGMHAFIGAFHAAHRQEYGYDIPGKAIEIVNCRLQAVGRVTKAPLTKVPIDSRKPGSPDAARSGSRTIYHGAKHGWLDTPVSRRAGLPPGCVLLGPAVIEEMSSTILLAPGQRGRVDGLGNVVIEIQGVNRDSSFVPALPKV